MTSKDGWLAVLGLLMYIDAISTVYLLQLAGSLDGELNPLIRWAMQRAGHAEIVYIIKLVIFSALIWFRDSVHLITVKVLVGIHLLVVINNLFIAGGVL